MGELLGKKVGQGVAEFLAREFASPTLKFPANKFEPVRFGAAETLHGQRQTLSGMIGNRKHAAREIKLFRPKMQQRFFTAAAHFPGHPRKRRNTTAVLANLNNAGGGELLEAGLQFSREFHGKIINEIHSCGNMFSTSEGWSVILSPLAAHDEPLEQWFRKVRGAHAFLNDGNIVWHPPKLNNLVLHGSNRKSRTRIAVTRVSDRTRIQEIAARKLGMQRGKRFAGARANLQDLQLRVLIRKATLVMCVPEKSDAGSGV